MVKCLECDAEITIAKDVIEGEIVSCPDCGSAYEVYKEGNDFQIRPAKIEGEDWGE